eukprot:2578406-Pyramimonas_sp.AAC.2
MVPGRDRQRVGGAVLHQALAHVGQERLRVLANGLARALVDLRLAHDHGLGAAEVGVADLLPEQAARREVHGLASLLLAVPDGVALRDEAVEILLGQVAQEPRHHLAVVLFAQGVQVVVHRRTADDDERLAAAKARPESGQLPQLKRRGLELLVHDVDARDQSAPQRIRLDRRRRRRRRRHNALLRVEQAIQDALHAIGSHRSEGLLTPAILGLLLRAREALHIGHALAAELHRSRDVSDQARQGRVERAVRLEQRHLEQANVDLGILGLRLQCRQHEVVHRLLARAGGSATSSE